MAVHRAGRSGQERGRGQELPSCRCVQTCSSPQGSAQSLSSLSWNCQGAKGSSQDPKPAIGEMELQACPEFLQCLQAQELKSRHPNPASPNGASGLVPLACCYSLWLSPQSTMAVNTHQITPPLAPALCRPVVWNTTGSHAATASHPASKA